MNKCQFIIDDKERTTCDKETAEDSIIYDKHYCQEHYDKMLALIGFRRTSSIIDEHGKYIDPK